MEIDERYKDREHSLIKHELLKGYLEKLLFIVARGGVKEITYVDCFAGPWGDESGELKATSIAISLEILHKVRNALAASPHNIHDTKYRAIFVEKSPKRYKKMKEYLNANCPPKIECKHLKGDYSELQDQILELCGKGFTFFFVDPKGWTDVGIPRLKKLLARKDSEFLIIFMYDSLNRFIGKNDLRQQVCNLLGDISDEYIKCLSETDSKERELSVVRHYRDTLKTAMPATGIQNPRSYHATVLDKDKDRTKYHLVYLTHHPKGIIEFSRISEEVDVFQRKVRTQTKFSKKEATTGITDMFGLEEDISGEQESVDVEVVKQYWLTILETEPKPFTEADLADILEETSWLESDLQTAFKELLKENLVENIDSSAKRRKYFIHFKNSERLRKLQ